MAPARGRASKVVFAWLALLTAAGQPAVAGAKSLRSDRGGDRGDGGSEEMLAELERALGSGVREEAERRVGELQEVMRPIFKSLWLSSSGRLPLAGARYLLRRTAQLRYGWFALDVIGDVGASNGSSPWAVFTDDVGGRLKALDLDMGGRNSAEEGGVTLYEAAVLAATLESLVHEETVGRLHAAYSLMDVSEDTSAEDEVELALDTWLVLFMSDMNHTETTKAEVVEQRMSMDADQEDPSWPAALRWVREVREEITKKEEPQARTSFEAVAKVTGKLTETYGQWQDRECQDLRRQLIGAEHGGTGRVLLSDFYEMALKAMGNSTWQFESQDYLRKLGALDETDPSKPSIIIPNYMAAPSNCVFGSAFFQMCCSNQCEALLLQLEQKVAAPYAQPGDIAAAVEKMPSSTVDAPVELSAALLSRLEEIAVLHGGRVPIHGLLFGQWLHSIYPRECPVPRLTAAPKRDSENEVLGAALMTKEDMTTYVQDYRKSLVSDQEANVFDEANFAELPWSVQEEMLARLPQGRLPWGFARGALSFVMFVAMLGSMSAVLLKTVADCGPHSRAEQLSELKRRVHGGGPP